MNVALLASGNVFELDRARSHCASCGLLQLCLPAAIDGEQIKRLERIVDSRRRIERGITLCRQGAPANALFVIRSGSFKTTVASADGKEQIIGFHHAGEVLGLDALNGNRHCSSAQALEVSHVCEVPYDRLMTIAAQVPGLNRQLLRVVSREMSRDHEHLVALGRTQAMHRLVGFLLAQCARYRELRRDPSRLRLSMSRSELANFLGLALETVSRLFSRLVKMKVLEVKARAIRVIDFEQLERLCHDAAGDGEPHSDQRRG